jgi:hypothetical protein
VGDVILALFAASLLVSLESLAVAILWPWEPVALMEIIVYPTRRP